MLWIATSSQLISPKTPSNTQIFPSPLKRGLIPQRIQGKRQDNKQPAIFINHLDYEKRLSHQFSLFHISSFSFLSNARYNSTPQRSKWGKWKRLDIKSARIFHVFPDEERGQSKKRSTNNQYSPFVWSLREKKQKLWALLCTHSSCDDIFCNKKKGNEISTHIWDSNN